MRLLARQTHISQSVLALPCMRSDTASRAIVYLLHPISILKHAAAYCMRVTVAI